MFSHLHHDYEGETLQLAMLASQITFYYGTVWATFICPGYVNDMILYMIMKVLSRMECDTDVEKQTKRDLILEVPFAFSGLHVAGIHMTLNLAIGVGSAIFSLIVALVKLNFS